MLNKRELGTKKEQTAAKYLISNGIDIICMNFRCRIGEIDIIGKDGDFLVFFEVKYRSTPKYGLPEEAVDRRKQHRIKQTAQYFMLTHNISQDMPLRFDIVSLLGNKIKHIRNAF